MIAILLILAGGLLGAGVRRVVRGARQRRTRPDIQRRRVERLTLAGRKGGQYGPF